MRYRLTGIGNAAFSLQWERKDDDAELVRRVLNLLQDRRLLWQDFSLEIQEHCVASADQIRKSLLEHMNNPEISPHLESRLRALQGYFRAFMTEVGDDDHIRRHMRPHATDPLSEALGRLRALVGVEIGALAAIYDLDVPGELANIVPDSGGWFWERFGAN